MQLRKTKNNTWSSTRISLESVKWRAWHARVLGVFVCLHALRAWHACMLKCFLAWCILAMMKCFIFLCVCILDVLFCLICFTFQYLNLKILTAKNLHALSSWTYFLFIFWYQLIKFFETNLMEAGNSVDISYRCSYSKAISIFYSLYIHLLH